MRPAFHRLDVAADALADLIFLGRHALAVGQKRLVFAQVNGHVRPLEPPHDPAHDVPDAVLEFRENELFLGPANVLHQRLLGILGGDAAEAGRGHFHFQFLAQLRVGLDAAGVKDGNLVVLGENLFRDHEFGEGLDVAGSWYQ